MIRDPATIAPVVYGGRPLSNAESAVAERFLGLYSLPAKAS